MCFIIVVNVSYFFDGPISHQIDAKAVYHDVKRFYLQAMKFIPSFPKNTLLFEDNWIEHLSESDYWLNS